jgi:carbon-monoxide dehydrogenase large subunit
MYQPRHPALVVERVRRVGDYVAFVVADTLAQAKDAAELIEVDYDIQPSITDTAAALEPGALRVWDDCPDNICFVYTHGDTEAVDAAFAKADHVISKRFVINRVTAATMEPRGCLGDYDALEDRYTLYDCLQSAFTMRTQLAGRVFRVPESKFRIIAGNVGGSFGMKSAPYNELILCLWASRRLGRPVKWTSDRSESFLCDNQARDNVTVGELALDANGRFLGQRVRTIAAIGAYLSATGSNPPVSNLGTLSGVYTTPAICVDVTGVFTHTSPTAPYRGAGRPEAAYVIERLVDLAADKLGMDPAELRRINTIPSDAMPFKTGLIFEFDCGEFEKNMDLTMEMADCAGFEGRRTEALTHGKLRGIGISNTIERAAAPGIEAAEVRYDRSGAVTLLSGSIDQGQGHETIYKQILCDRLGLKPEDVRYVSGDTDKVAFGHGTGGSRSATLGGAAVMLATEKIVEKAKKIAAHLMEAADADLEFDEGTFTVAGTDRTISMAEVAKAAFDLSKLPDGMEPGLDESRVYEAKVMNFPNGCHICELEIDEETGRVQILRYSVVDDVGTVMNPLLLKGQIQGGIAQGLGQALMEDIRHDPDSGQLLSGTFMDYAMPRADDISMMEVVSNPVPTATNPLGVKGAGEAGNVGGLAAVANAVVDALSPLGVDHIAMPATPEVIWRAIQDARG